MPNSIANIIKTVLTPLARSRFPKVDGKLQLRGLHGPVEVIRDQIGIPHIYAQDLHDLFFAQGFTHGQERLFQMDFNRRLVAGRLSEVLGSLTVPVDRWMRTLTMRRVAEFEAGLQDEETRSFLQAYADGINAFISQGKLPLEFTLLRYRPEPWIIADSLAWTKMMSWSLCVNWETEILRARLIERLGPDLASELEPPRLERWPIILPEGSDYSYIGEAALDRARLARPFIGPSPYEGLGSNNWVISGKHTATGRPLLANDMHLQLTIPSIWFENHISAEESGINATGVSFPGLPGVIAGHNGHVAWGYTDGFPDVQDLYMERLRRLDDGCVQAEYKDEWEDVKVLKELIQVKGKEPVIEEVVITRHGPVINILAPDFTGEQPLALRWTSLEPDTIAQGLFAMLRARNCLEFHESLRAWTSPTQNTIYADTHGNIGYTFPGKIPLRAKGDGRYPVPGWTDEYEWQGYIPFDALPHLYNPPQGFIATANNRAFSDDYPIPISLEPISGDRSQRIVEMIQDRLVRQGKPIDIPYIQSMQFDQISESARIIIRHLGQLNLEKGKMDAEVRLAIRMLRNWDGKLSAGSPTAAIYEAYIRKMAYILLSPRLGDELTLRYMGKGPTPVLAELTLFGEFYLPWLARLLAEEDSHWFNLGHGETRLEVIHLALRAALDDLISLLGPQIETWEWGKLHQITYHHVLGSNEVLGAFFNRGPYPVGGDQTTIWATGASYYSLQPAPFIGPPFRMIADLGNLSNTLGLLTPGQSANPASPHYDDQVLAWTSKGYHKLLWEREDVERGKGSLLRLLPA